MTEAPLPSEPFIDVWRMRFDGRNRLQWLELAKGKVAEEEHHRAAAMRGDKRLKEFLAGRLIARQALGRRMNVADVTSIEMTVTEHGKPVLKNKDDLWFSISHSDGLAVCAVSDVAVGVDIERIDRMKQPLDFARTHFHAQECAYIEGLIDDDRHQGVMGIWTLKEAIAKATGLGLALPLKDSCFAFDINGLIEVKIDNQDVKPDWWLDHFQPDSGLIGALASAHIAKPRVTHFFSDKVKL